MRWTVDYQEDLHFVEQVFKAFQGQEAIFGLPRLLEFLSKNPTLSSSIDGRRRNESLLKELGDNNE
jgi:spore coat polysaccharide biosynthesis protein SpsF (cytidylyltransferase family)